jgi:hypothetical protein
MRQGWVVLIVLPAAIAAAALLLMPGHLVAFLGFNPIMLLLLTCYAKRAAPASRWGGRG